ncbi:hypothetical protein BPIT_04960 [Candidatus Brocadia pituitae]|nr:hypothetical protein BPIT_04960 [Candidatus Brocadia pituitae]
MWLRLRRVVVVSHTTFDESGKTKPMIKLKGKINPMEVRSRGSKEMYSPIPTLKSPRTPRTEKICSGSTKHKTNNVIIKTLKAC